MSDRKALLDAVWESPYDDAVRLVYSDWLEEHGEVERAAFIRVQVRRACMHGAAPDWPELERHACARGCSSAASSRPGSS
jgi:uncharacterized protein (TIGR02996 family)